MSTILFTVPCPSHPYPLLSSQNVSKWRFWRNSQNNFLIFTKQSMTCAEGYGRDSPSSLSLFTHLSAEHRLPWLQVMCALLPFSRRFSLATPIPSAFNRDPIHFATPLYHHAAQKPPFSLKRALNSVATQPGPAIAP